MPSTSSLRLLLIVFGLACVHCDRPTLRALVIEYEDPRTKTRAGAEILEEAGFEVRRLLLPAGPDGEGAEPVIDPGEPALPVPTLGSLDTDLVVLGSFVSDHPLYDDLLQRNRERLQWFVEEGGVLLQFTQEHGTERFPAFLPEGLSARRTYTDSDEVFVLDDAHPIAAALPREPARRHRLPIFRHLGKYASWESFREWSGFGVILAGDPDAQYAVLLEGEYGEGRILLTSMFLDKRPAEEASISADYTAMANGFMRGLREYVQLVRGGRAPAVVPTVAYNAPPSLPFTDGAWTLAILPDTQTYTAYYPELFEAQTRWLAENAESRNIAFVLHVGDLVQEDVESQWEIARRNLRRLDGAVPYAVTLGNHDYASREGAARRETLFRRYFPVSRYRGRATFGGVYDAEPERLDNSYSVFRAGGREWLVLALEFGPRREVVDWGNRVLAEHREKHAILLTHAYLYSDDTRYDREGRRNDGTGRLASRGEAGGVVHQIAANYQHRERGGWGLLRLMEFQPDGRRVYVKTYSPSLNAYLTNSRNQFVLELEGEP
jgi:3',5'-cyclic AMP phosphodiesterase CpdA